MTSFVHRFHVPVDHAALAGHFPGQPILPGVLLLAEVMRALRAAPMSLGPHPEIVSAKFLAPLRPGQSAEVRLVDAVGGLRFEIAAGAVIAASGQLREGAVS